MDIVWLAAGAAVALPVLWLCVRFAFKKRLQVHRGRLVQQLRTTEELARATQFKLNMTREVVDKMEARQNPLLDELENLRTELTELYAQKGPDASVPSEPSQPAEPAESEKIDEAATTEVADAESAREAAEKRAVTLEADLRAIRHQLQISKDAQAINVRRLNDLEAANKDLRGEAKDADSRAQTLQLKIKQDATENDLIASETRDRISNLQEIVSQRDKQIKLFRAEIADLKSEDEDAPEAPDTSSKPHLALVTDDEAENGSTEAHESPGPTAASL